MPRKLRGPTSLRRELGPGRSSESEIREAYYALVGLPAEATDQERTQFQKFIVYNPKACITVRQI